MILNYQDAQALPSALEALQGGEVIIYPSDTLYGFGCAANYLKAIQKIVALKKRPRAMPFSLMVGDLQMLKKYAQVSDIADSLIRHFLPGALTLILPSYPGKLPDFLYSDGNYLGFRIPDHSFCRELSANFPYPILSSSVNISGQQPMIQMEHIQKAFDSQVGLMIEDKELEKSLIASTVLRIDPEGSIDFLREGRIPFSDIKAFLEKSQELL